MNLTADPDLAHTQQAMHMLEGLLESMLEQSEAAVRDRVDNALLNIAVNRIIDVEGEAVTATILWRLADAINSGVSPNPEQAIELTQLHG